MRKVFCLAVLVLLAGCKKPDANGMYADGTLAKGHAGIQGVVNEGFGDIPVSGVTVQIEDQQVTTDDKGEFVIFVPPGNYNVWFRKDGYQRNIAPYVAKPTDGMFWDMKVRLEKEPTPEQMKEQANSRILDSLTIDAVTDRCGPPDGERIGLASFLTYSNAFNTGPVEATKYGSVTIHFEYNQHGPVDAEATPHGSYHSATISRYELVKVMPCLLNGGVAQ
jgi:Carboxypeptidase regulatory-like domain